VRVALHESATNDFGLDDIEPEESQGANRVRVSAIIVINDQPPATSSRGDASFARSGLSRCPITCAEILGQSVVERTILRLRQAGVESISLIGGREVYSLPVGKALEVVCTENSAARWPAAQRKVAEQKAQGISSVIVIGLGAYIEVNVPSAVKFHLAHGTPLTQLEDCDGNALDFWIVDTEWFRTAATGCTFPFRYGEFPGLPVPCKMTGYVNRLQDAADFRRLVVDSFLAKCEIRPRGSEMKPGIWMDDGARVHRNARLVAPIYLGRYARVDSSAVVTRFSNVEREAYIGGGTVVDQASILPHTVLGRGLDVSRSVVHGNTLVNLDRNIVLKIDDPNLIRDTARMDPRVRVLDRGRQTTRREPFGEFAYMQVLSRAAGRFSEVFFKG